MRARWSYYFIVLILLLFTNKIWSNHIFYLEEKSERYDESVIEEEIEVNNIQNLLTSGFCENKGQVKNDEVLYYGYLNSGMIGFGVSKIFLWGNEATNQVTLHFENSTRIYPEVDDSYSHQSNYFLGNKGTYVDVKVYKRILYHNPWPGVDFVYRLSTSGVMYEFTLEPNANLDEIRISYEGDDALELGAYHLDTVCQGLVFRNDNLTASQADRAINIRFKHITEDTIGFAIENYNPTKELVIDALLYVTNIGVCGEYGSYPLDFSSLEEPDIISSFLGGSFGDYGWGIEVDSFGYVYICGSTRSTDFPIVSPIKDSIVGNYDAFIMKLNPNLDSIIWSTFLGGSRSDVAYAITIGPDGGVYCTGYSMSEDFPAVNAYDSSYNDWDDFDIIVFKLSNSGNQLVYSTYVGSSSDQKGYAITVDQNCSAYVVGTSGAFFPVVGNFGLDYGGNNDIVLFKLSKSGKSLLFSGYLGGSSSENGYDLKLNTEGHIVVAGRSSSSDYPIESGFDETYNEGSDGVITIVNRTGYNLICSTFIGGDMRDLITGLELDMNDDIIVTGNTESSNFPFLNGYDDTFNGNYDVFVSKFNSSCNGLLFSTYIGGSSDDYVRSVSIDVFGDIYAVGYTLSSNFPTKLAIDDAYSGEEDGFVFKLNNSGNDLIYSTYFGGSLQDEEYSISVNMMGHVYCTGWTVSSDFPAEDGFDSSFNGHWDGYVFSFSAPDDLDSDGAPDYIELNLGTMENDNDTDSDGLPDGWEIMYNLNPFINDTLLDPDNDTLSNIEEYQYLTQPNNNDTDGDTIPDGYEVFYGLSPISNDANDDLDSDGLNNILEYQNDCIPNDNDTDDDLMLDGWEFHNGLNPVLDDSDEDPDNDLLSNINEYTNGTNPQNNDTDLDMMPDGWEVLHQLNPIYDDSQHDFDEDGLTNLEEYNLGSYPDNIDSDGDSIPDGWEVSNGLNATEPEDALMDFDSDGLTNLEEYSLNTDLNNPDSDNDGLSDGSEVNSYDTDPLDSDSDNDTVTDGQEINQYDTDPLDSDSDDDGLSDGEEIFTHGTNPNSADTDNDGISDKDEIETGLNPLIPDTDRDSDGDGLSDYQEYQLGTNPLEEDSDGDGLPDGWEVARGLDPLAWSERSGEALENLGNFVILGGGLALLSLIFLIVTGIRKINKTPLPILRKRILIVPGIILILVLFTTVPTTVMGTTDPGSNAHSSSSEQYTFNVLGGPWFTKEITVSVSARLTVDFEYIDGAVTVSRGGSSVGSFNFEFGRSPFIETETKTRTFSVSPGSVTIQISYRYYDHITNEDLGSYSIRSSVTQGESDGRNEDQKSYPLVLGIMYVISFGTLILGIFLPTDKIEKWIKKRSVQDHNGVQSIGYNHE